MIKTKKISYTNGQDIFQGVVAWDSSSQAKRPAVLVAHAYFGQLQFEENKAIALAEIGYVGFAIDMYGKGKRASSPEEARSLMGELNANRAELLARIQLGLKTAQEFELTNPTKMAAIGFCFGGKCVLDLARSGENLKGVASFHGIYDKPELNQNTPIKAAVLVFHGWEDPLATPKQTVALAQELTERNADWNICAYGHTGHAFTNPNANSPETGMLFNKKSTNRSWRSLTNFLAELFE